MEGYCVPLPKPPRKPIPSLGYSIIRHHGFTILEGYYSCSKNTIHMQYPLYGIP